MWTFLSSFFGQKTESSIQTHFTQWQVSDVDVGNLVWFVGLYYRGVDPVPWFGLVEMKLSRKQSAAFATTHDNHVTWLTCIYMDDLQIIHPTVVTWGLKWPLEQLQFLADVLVLFSAPACFQLITLLSDPIKPCLPSRFHKKIILSVTFVMSKCCHLLYVSVLGLAFDFTCIHGSL